MTRAAKSNMRKATIALITISILLVIGLVGFLVIWNYLKFSVNVPCNDLSGDLPVGCQASITPSEAVLVTIDIDGTMRVWRNDQILISFIDSFAAEEEDKLIIDSVSDGKLIPDSFEFADINFDGNADLKVATSRGAYNFQYSYYLYDPQNNTFDPKPFLADMWNTEFDKKAKTITTLYKGRGVGDIYREAVYLFEGGRYNLIKQINQSFVNGENEEAGYVHTVKERKNGAMVVTESKIISEPF